MLNFYLPFLNRTKGEEAYLDLVAYNKKLVKESLQEIDELHLQLFNEKFLPLHIKKFDLKDKRNHNNLQTYQSIPPSNFELKV